MHVGSTQANLLLPLYGVVAVAAIALAWELFGDGERSRELGPLASPLALFVGWEGLTFLWTKDVRQGAIELLFFVLPFGLLAVVLARLPWSRAWVLTLYVQLAVMALVFAVIGIVQYETRNIFWNPKVRVDNAYAPSGWFYRVNSVFYDPSIYGRFLVIAILGEPRRRAAAAAATRSGGSPPSLTIGITWAGLLPSFSQSSFVALIAAIVVGGVVVVAAARPAPRRARAIVVVFASRSSSRPQSGTARRSSHVDERALDARLEGRQGRRPPSGDRRRASAASAAPTATSRTCAARSRRPPPRTRRRSRSRPRLGLPGPAALRVARRAPPSSRRSAGSARRSTVPRGSRSD